MTADRPLLGILLMLGFCVLAPLGDSMAKVLGAAVPLIVLLTARFAIQALVLLPLARISGAALRLPPRILGLTALRTMLHLIGIAMMFVALRYLPLAETIAIAFVMPFIMLLLGHFVLREEVGPRRMIACAIGFAGTLMVVQPSFAEVGAPAFLPLGVAVVFALFMLITRQVAKSADPIAMQAVSGAMASLVLVPACALALLAGWTAPARYLPGEWLLLLALGLLGTGAHLLMTWSLRFAPASTVAPMQYLEIPFATLIGWLIFRDFPNGLALVGIAVTMGAGLYVILRERRVQRTVTPAPPD